MRRKTLAIVVAVSILSAATLAAGLALVLMELRPRLPGAAVEALLGETHVRFPPELARLPEARHGGALDQLDLAVTFPGFQAPLRHAGEAATAMVFIHLTPQGHSLDPAERPVRLYAPFLDLVGQGQDGGLVMRRFVAGSPYQTENLYLAPPEGRLFWARCLRPAQPPAALPDTCLSDLRLHGLDVQVRFDPALLPEWERLAAGVRRVVEGMAR